MTQAILIGAHRMGLHGRTMWALDFALDMDESEPVFSLPIPLTDTGSGMPWDAFVADATPIIDEAVQRILDQRAKAACRGASNGASH